MLALRQLGADEGPVQPLGLAPAGSHLALASRPPAMGQSEQPPLPTSFSSAGPDLEDLLPFVNKLGLAVNGCRASTTSDAHGHASHCCAFHGSTRRMEATQILSTRKPGLLAPIGKAAARS